MMKFHIEAYNGARAYHHNWSCSGANSGSVCGCAGLLPGIIVCNFSTLEIKLSQYEDNIK